MDSIIKGFLGSMFIVILAFLGYGLMSASLQARNADAFAADCVKKIENSNYSMQVIEACKEDAAHLGYALTVDAYGAAGSSRCAYGSLHLTYQYAVPLLNIQEERDIRSDMR